jgi:glycosyltransferase 2 family protein
MRNNEKEQQGAILKKKQLIVGLVVTVALIGFGIWAHSHIHFDWKTFREQIARADWRLIAIAMGCIYLGYVFRALRWALFLKPAKKVSPWSILGTQVIGFTAVALLGRAADLVRPYLVAKRVSLPIGSQMAVYIVDRMFDTGSMALFFSTILLLAPDRAVLPHPELLKKVAVSGLFLTFALAIFTVVVRLAGGFVAAIAEKALGAISPKVAHSVGEKIRTFRDGLNTLTTPLDVVKAAVLSLTMWGLIITAYFLTMRAFVESPQLAHITLAQGMVVEATGMVASGFQLPILGWFTQIGIVSAAMQNLFGVAWEPALGSGAMLLIVTFLSVIPVGLIWAQFENVSLRKVAKESEHVAEEINTSEVAP